jgi:hypothetical protein
MVPITIGIIGARSAGADCKRSRCPRPTCAARIVYSALGIAAGFTGMMFGCLDAIDLGGRAISFFFVIMAPRCSASSTSGSVRAPDALSQIGGGGDSAARS